jgi:hypothetical protein
MSDAKRVQREIYDPHLSVDQIKTARESFRNARGHKTPIRSVNNLKVLVVSIETSDSYLSEDGKREKRSKDKLVFTCVVLDCSKVILEFDRIPELNKYRSEDMLSFKIPSTDRWDTTGAKYANDHDTRVPWIKYLDRITFKVDHKPEYSNISRGSMCIVNGLRYVNASREGQEKYKKEASLRKHAQYASILSVNPYAVPPHSIQSAHAAVKEVQVTSVMADSNQLAFGSPKKKLQDTVAPPTPSQQRQVESVLGGGGDEAMFSPVVFTQETKDLLDEHQTGDVLKPTQLAQVSAPATPAPGMTATQAAVMGTVAAAAAATTTTTNKTIELKDTVEYIYFDPYKPGMFWTKCNEITELEEDFPSYISKKTNFEDIMEELNCTRAYLNLLLFAIMDDHQPIFPYIKDDPISRYYTFAEGEAIDDVQYVLEKLGEDEFKALGCMKIQGSRVLRRMCAGTVLQCLSKFDLVLQKSDKSEEIAAQLDEVRKLTRLNKFKMSEDDSSKKNKLTDWFSYIEKKQKPTIQYDMTMNVLLSDYENVVRGRVLLSAFRDFAEIVGITNLQMLNDIIVNNKPSIISYCKMNPAQSVAKHKGNENNMSYNNYLEALNAKNEGRAPSTQDDLVKVFDMATENLTEIKSIKDETYADMQFNICTQAFYTSVNIWKWVKSYGIPISNELAFEYVLLYLMSALERKNYINSVGQFTPEERQATKDFLSKPSATKFPVNITRKWPSFGVSMGYRRSEDSKYAIENKLNQEGIRNNKTLINHHAFNVTELSCADISTLFRPQKIVLCEDPVSKKKRWVYKSLQRETDPAAKNESVSVSSNVDSKQIDDIFSDTQYKTQQNETEPLEQANDSKTRMHEPYKFYVMAASHSSGCQDLMEDFESILKEQEESSMRKDRPTMDDIKREFVLRYGHYNEKANPARLLSFYVYAIRNPLPKVQQEEEEEEAKGVLLSEKVADVIPIQTNSAPVAIVTQKTTDPIKAQPLAAPPAVLQSNEDADMFDEFEAPQTDKKHLPPPVSIRNNSSSTRVTDLPRAKRKHNDEDASKPHKKQRIQ